MRQNLKSIDCEISPGIFVLNNLKGTVKAHAVDILRLITLKATKTALLTPMSTHVLFKWKSPSRVFDC